MGRAYTQKQPKSDTNTKTADSNSNKKTKTTTTTHPLVQAKNLVQDGVPDAVRHVGMHIPADREYHRRLRSPSTIRSN